MSEKRNHPGHLGALPAHKGHISRSPSPLSGQASGSFQPNARPLTLGLRTQQQRRSTAEHPAFTSNETYGTTPNYELPADGMFSPADGQPAYWTDETRSQSVPPKILVQHHIGAGGARRVQPPQIDTSNVYLSRRDSLRDEQGKRPTSPHITSATPTSARHHHAHFPSAPKASHEQTRSTRSPGPIRIASPSLLPMGFGRAAVSAAQSLMDAVAGRASPLSARTRQALKERDSTSDDEAGKGHGRKPVGRQTPMSHQQQHPQHHQHKAHFDTDDAGVSGNVEWRTSISESRRGTPAAYRPKIGSPSYEAKSRGSSDGRLASSHHSTHSSILIGSPIVVPQARRGAVRLRPRRRRRVIRPVKPCLSLRQRLLVVVATMIHLLRLLASPIEATRRLKEWCIDTRISIDESFRDPRTGVRSYYPPWLQAYVPLFVWLCISLSSTATVITFHTEVFVGLDHLATYLQESGFRGKVMLGALIFLTTFPPLPLYSTLIMLCGFTFGLWQGFVISYIAALSGAIVVFMLSRSLLKDWMVGLLNKSGGLKKVVRAIEKQPKLLFLVRLAPYPYNLMNTLLASSPTLSLKTYVTCTALALPKLLIHTGLGTSIKSFASYNGAGEKSAEDAQASHTAETVKKWAGVVGLGLCIGIMVYLLSVARKAVDDLDDDLDDEDDVLLDGEDRDLLSFSEDEDDQDGVNDEPDHWMRETEADLRERRTRNDFAHSPEERLRHTMRTTGTLVSMPLSLSVGNGSGSVDERTSQHTGSAGGQSIDLAERIAELEAHAEEMQFGTPIAPANNMDTFATPFWSPAMPGHAADYSDDDDQEDAHFQQPPYRTEPRALFLE